jgi:hypothetical protein
VEDTVRSMTTRFLSGGEPWPAIEGTLRRRNRASAYMAIGFIGRTGGSLLHLKRGDVLVCDASEQAVRLGATDPLVLMALKRKGVAVHSFKGLHAKCSVVGRRAWVGSANASRNSRDNLLEAAVEVTDGSTVAEVRAWIQRLAAGSPELDEAELERLTRFRPEHAPASSIPYEMLELPVDAKRLYLTGFDWGVSRKATSVANRSQADVRKAAQTERLRSSALDWFEWNGKPAFVRGDWLIDATRGRRVSRPLRVHTTVVVEGDNVVVWFLPSDGGRIPRRADLLNTALGRDEFDDSDALVARRRVKRALALYQYS